eukprot:CAMPEP_0206006746 /NCGR_PEP_ID=MMETSP1464-20131121/5358_1 /ASSEMBLY_ACC=CAM_ASM_001124 /TAXON_ID=119497 /ORGANISM="Exanthemachrysis gayraliae, Strain RCC1523" /LENGTH=54 /DNA_ID=CAMNT_0053380229 /DNA_START=805 /DNA_END=965 /DNA_ORIENTATION=-
MAFKMRRSAARHVRHGSRARAGPATLERCQVEAARLALQLFETGAEDLLGAVLG